MSVCVRACVSACVHVRMFMFVCMHARTRSMRVCMRGEGREQSMIRVSTETLRKGISTETLRKGIVQQCGERMNGINGHEVKHIHKSLMGGNW